MLKVPADRLGGKTRIRTNFKNISSIMLCLSIEVLAHEGSEDISK